EIVQGLPQPIDNFPRRVRNKIPLAIRQIIDTKVLHQWARDPQHVTRALNQSVREQEQKQKQQQRQGMERSLPTATTTNISTPGTNLSSLDQFEEPLLPVMVAEDSKNFIDNPQFTRKINMTANEIIERVLVRPSSSSMRRSLSSMSALSLSDAGSDTEDTRDASATKTNNWDIIQETEVVSVDAQTCHNNKPSGTNIAPISNNCPLCENQANQQADFEHLNSINDGDNNSNNNYNNDILSRDLLQYCRFYYRGMVPSSLYTDLQIPALLSSLSLPQETTAFANAPNRDLMRIWISLAGATTPLHYDRCHGVLIQLVGRKRFVVFSHEDTNNLYPYDGIAGPGHASKVRGLGHCFPFNTVLTSKESPSKNSSGKEGEEEGKEDMEHLRDNMAELLERWPKVKNADPWVIDLEPGDALYTPPGFWHEVISVDNSISITVPWDMDANELEHVPHALNSENARLRLLLRFVPYDK
ncbi:hypothetical protein BX616_001681, partial [Lobosporangium transversale]